MILMGCPLLMIMLPSHGQGTIVIQLQQEILLLTEKQILHKKIKYQFNEKFYNK